MRGQGPWADLLAHPLRQGGASATAWREASSRCAATCSSRPQGDQMRLAVIIRRTAVTARGARRLASRHDQTRPRAARRRRSPLPLLAQTAAAARRRRSPSTPWIARAARRRARNDDYAWDITEGLTTEVGPAHGRHRGRGPRPRLGGRQAAARWASPTSASSVRHAGVGARRRKRRDPRALPAETGGRRARQFGLDPPGGHRPARSSASTASTRSSAAPDAAVRGKIVFVDHRMPRRPRTASGYGQFGAPRRQGPTIASRKGAIAIVIRSIGTDHHRNPHTGVMSFADGATPIPAGALTIPDAEQLAAHPQARQAGDDAAARSKARRIAKRAVGQCHRRSPGPRSRARRRSWSAAISTAGTRAPARSTMPPACAIAAAAAKRIMDAGRPLRTIRIVWFGAEEVGLFGGLDYRAAPRQGAALRRSPKAISAPTASGRSTASSARRAATRRARSAPRSPRSASSPARSTRPTARTSARCSPTACPGSALNQDGTRYFDLHHTPDDTLDKVDPAQLRQNVAAWTAMLAILSGGIEQPKRAAPALNARIHQENDMNRIRPLLILAPPLLLGACQVTDDSNGSTTISIDENRIEQGADALANEADKAGDEAANAHRAMPVPRSSRAPTTSRNAPAASPTRSTMSMSTSTSTPATTSRRDDQLSELGFATRRALA